MSHFTMKLKILCAVAILLAGASAASAKVRIAVKNGKRIIYNDGVGESVGVARGWSDAWLAARVAMPSNYDRLINEAAHTCRIDPKLVKSVMLIESEFDSRAVSRKGARGLMQLMPETAERYGIRDSFDPLQNISGGTRHLAYLLELYGGDTARTLAAYNAGESAVAKYSGIPPYSETIVYVRKGLAAYGERSSLGGGFGLPPTKSWGSSRNKPVRLTRDSKNRPLLTTDFSPPRALRRG